MSRILVQIILLCIAGTVMIVPAGAEVTTISPGAEVFIGEAGLDISGAVAGYDEIAWWPSTAWPDSTVPEKVIDIRSVRTSFFADPTDISARTGNWYCYRSGQSLGGSPVAFRVLDPSIDLSVRDLDTDTDVTGRVAVFGDRLTFRIQTNQHTALDPAARPNTDPSDGFVTIRVRNEDGVLYDSLHQAGSVSKSLKNQYVDTGLWYWGGAKGSSFWDTGAKSEDGQQIYEPGTYTISAESFLNGMKDNYRNAGMYYYGKTVSERKTINIIPDRVMLESNHDHVAKGSTFSFQVSGKPKTLYHLWVMGTGAMTGNPQDQPPTIVSSDQVIQDPDEGPYAIGSYAFAGGDGKTILDDVPPSTAAVPKTRYYAGVVTNANGVRTLNILTSGDTKPGTYTFIVENGTHSDTVPVGVHEGPLPASSWIVSDISVVPSGYQPSGMPATVSFTVRFEGLGDDTFPMEHSFQLSTDLDDPDWDLVLVLNDIDNPQPVGKEKTVELTGWILSYDADDVGEELRVTLQGMVPRGPNPEKFFIRIQELDEDGNVIPETIVVKRMPAIDAHEFPSVFLPAVAVLGLLITALYDVRRVRHG